MKTRTPVQIRSHTGSILGTCMLFVSSGLWRLKGTNSSAYLNGGNRTAFIVGTGRDAYLYVILKEGEEPPKGMIPITEES